MPRFREIGSLRMSRQNENRGCFGKVCGLPTLLVTIIGKIPASLVLPCSPDMFAAWTRLNQSSAWFPANRLPKELSRRNKPWTKFLAFMMETFWGVQIYTK